MQFQVRFPHMTQDLTINVPARCAASSTWEAPYWSLVGYISARANPAAYEVVKVMLSGDVGAPLAIAESASLQEAVRARYAGDTSKRIIQVFLRVDPSAIKEEEQEVGAAKSLEALGAVPAEQKPEEEKKQQHLGKSKAEAAGSFADTMLRIHKSPGQKYF